ncbi:MAG: hypothetical protein IMZ71_02815 [Chloroflexi bacterium]|nr:hypothetical protein [Chloroflexota bacterium]
MTVNPDFILTGMGKATIARKLFAQGQSLIASNLAGNQWQGKFQPVASPYVDSVKGASPVKLFVGEFRKQFIYTEVFAPEVLSAKPGNEMEWLRDVVYAWKARFMGGCGAVTNRYVVYSAAGG